MEKCFVEGKLVLDMAKRLVEWVNEDGEESVETVETLSATAGRGDEEK